MRRWNGWGEESRQYPLPASAIRFLVAVLGEGDPKPDATWEQVLGHVPTSRLPTIPLFTTAPGDRLLHARGQSLPDWIALRSGELEIFPDGVAYPRDARQVREIMEFARQYSIRLIPYGGGTSVVGHITPLAGPDPLLTLDLSKIDTFYGLDVSSCLATFGAGVKGPILEKALNSVGYTLGHFPQSFELSTLGGWVATRSSGQQSDYYGRIEDLFAGGHLETFHGPLDLPPFPASAAGPDLRQIVLGSEGRLGVITSAIVRVRRLPEFETFHGIFFRDWENGIAALRTLAQEGLALSMLRLSDAQETETTLELSGKDELVNWARHGLGMIGYGEGRCLLVMGITGTRRAANQALNRAMQVLRDFGGLPTGTTIGKLWNQSRFFTPFLRNTLWERGYALDTLETAFPWSTLLPAADSIRQALQQGIEVFGERSLIFAHLSHAYPSGASLYITYLFRRGHDPAMTLQRWRRMKTAASQAILAYGGTISHQHGVGVDHAPYLAAEKGEPGMRLLSAAVHSLDPDGLLNPGKLLSSI
jgi:alkyldihydroxyacetonephosphate synthase